MRVVRLSTRKHADLSGIGAELLGARWNSPGKAVAYTASFGALAALEYMVHMTDLPKNMMMLRIEVPDTLIIEQVDSLPADPAAFRQIGDEWLNDNGSVALRVPSVLVPRQWNILINPAHPLFPAIQIVERVPFAFDSRLLSSFPTPP